ncbi:Hypothetical_protein [Hexamita inflata]|uniref:Hypothetical_protein n=1 Tax=Hexamita inflata TaxID=28002 RepID=A0AA86N8E9_9EUKA|nr:Hypothetical protein HINF_LOCUS2271 [Hexamita inflata]
MFICIFQPSRTNDTPSFGQTYHNIRMWIYFISSSILLTIACVTRRVRLKLKLAVKMPKHASAKLNCHQNLLNSAGRARQRSTDLNSWTAYKLLCYKCFNKISALRSPYQNL